MVNILSDIPAFTVDTSVLEFATIIQILIVIEALVAVAVVCLFIWRIRVAYLEKEVVRFLICITNALSNTGIVVAVIRSAPSTLISIFYLIMLLREFLSFAVDRTFYQYYYPAKRRKISNRLLITIYVILYLILVSNLEDFA